MYSPKANKQQQKEIVPSIFLYGSCYIPVLSLPSTSKLNFSLAISFSLSFRIHAWAPSRLKKRLLKIACHSKEGKYSRTSPISSRGKGRQPSWLPTHSNIQAIAEFTWQNTNQQLPKTRSEVVFILACLFSYLHERNDWKSFILLSKEPILAQRKKSTALLCPMMRTVLGCFKESIMGLEP